MAIDFSNNLYGALRWLSYVIFAGFYFLCFRFLFNLLINYPAEFPILFILFLTGWIILTAWRALLGLILLGASIPLISGLQNLGLISNAPILSGIFSGIFLIWLPKRIFFEKNGILSDQRASQWMDILSGLILISLLGIILIHPSSLVWNRLWYIIPQSQNDPLYGLEAGFYVLQGLFFARLIILEWKKQNRSSTFINFIYIQAVVIILFSSIQIFLNRPAAYSGFAIFAPFDDIHSYGSYVVALMSIFLVLALGENRKALHWILLSCFIALVALSYSRISWLAAVCVFLALIVSRLPVKKTVIVLGILGGILITLNLFPDHIFRLEGALSNRFRQLVVFNEAVDHSRIVLWRRAYYIIREFPITGSGVGTFYRLSKEYQDARDSFYLGQSENAHNYFLQLAAEVGIPGLLVFCVILGILFLTPWTGDARAQEEKNSRKALYFGVGAYLITCLTGHPLILPNQEFLFWFLVAGIQIGHTDGKKRVRPQGSLTKGILFTIAVVVLGAAYWDKIGKTRAGNQTYEAGFYEFESWKGKNFRWMGKVGLLKFERKGKILSYEVYCAQQNIGRRGLNYKVFINGEEWEDIHFFRGGMQPRHFYLPERMGRWIEMKGVANRTFVPASRGLGPDTRVLGVAMSEIKFTNSLPEEGIGFYHWEEWKGPPVSDWPGHQPFRFRWMGRQASIPCPQDRQLRMKVFILATHPHIARNPIKLGIYCDDKEVHEETIQSNQWQHFSLNASKWKDGEVLTFRVNQTWNPKFYGLSEDIRDLGVAIALWKES